MNPTRVSTAADGRAIYFIHVPRTGGRSIARWFGVVPYSPNHMASAASAKRFDPKGIVFGVIRNPCERVISEYRFRYPDKDPGDCKRWVLTAKSVLTAPSWSARALLLDADHLIPFVHMEEWLRSMLAYYGAPQPEEPMPHVLEHAEKGEEAKRTLPSRDYLDYEAMRLIETTCQWDLSTRLC